MTGTAISGTLADLYMAGGSPLAFSAEAMTDSGDHIIYSITNAAKRYWDDATAPTIEISTDSGATWATASPNTYTVQYVGGLVTFGSSNSAREVRATGNYLAASQVGNAYNWEVTPTRKELPATVFGDTWEETVMGLLSATAKASRYFIDGSFQELLASRFILILYPDFGADIRFEAYAWLTTTPLKVSVSSTVDEELTWKIDGTLYTVFGS